MWPPLLPPDLELALPLAFPDAPVASDSFVYFDIGGVLIDLDWDAFFEAGAALARAHSKAADPSVAAEAFLSPAMRTALRDWSRGRTGPFAFARSFLVALGHDSASLAAPGAPGPLDVKEVSSLIVGPVRARSLRLVKRLRAAGVGVGVLSNAVPWHETDIEATLRLRDVFDVVIFSQDVGYEKPEQGIYAAAHEAAGRWMAGRASGGAGAGAGGRRDTARRGARGLSKSNTYFVDDLPQNVRAAREYGWNASLVCPLEPKLLEGIRSGAIAPEEGARRSSRSENLIFGDAAAARVEALFIPLLDALAGRGGGAHAK